MAHIYGAPNSRVITYYPSPISRTVPDWMIDFTIGLIGGEQEEMIGQLLNEVYAAVRGDQYRLATMGIRSVLERVMITKVGEHATFRENLEQFHAKGYLSLIQRDALDSSLEAGHAATHRLFNPTEQDLDILLNITEGFMAAIYIHPDQAESLSKRLPVRPSLTSDKTASPRDAVPPR